MWAIRVSSAVRVGADGEDGFDLLRESSNLVTMRGGKREEQGRDDGTREEADKVDVWRALGWFGRHQVVENGGFRG